jgi:hypothetical protein
MACSCSVRIQSRGCASANCILGSQRRRGRTKGRVIKFSLKRLTLCRLGTFLRHAGRSAGAKRRMLANELFPDGGLQLQLIVGLL